MRHGSMLLTALLATALSCGGCDDEAGGSAQFDGAACQSDDECRGDCVDGVCEGGGTGADGETCEGDTDCLGECEAGVCANAPANNGTNNTSNNGTAGPNNGTNGPSNNGSELWDPNQTREEFCMGSGPPIVVGGGPDGTAGICTGDIAQTTFRFALCICEDYGSSGFLKTDSFDSSKGPYDPNDPGAGGAVGVNGRYDSSGTAEIGGSLWVGSTQGISSGGDVTVENELRTNGNVTSSKTFQIARDAYVAGNVQVQDFNVGGQLFTPTGTTVDTQSPIDVVRQDVGEIEPCNCDDPLDIAGLIALNKQYNHNGDISLEPGALSSFSEDVEFDIDCGRFFIDEIVGSGNVTLNLSGRTAIFIEGDLAIAGELTINVAADASVDIFIAGDLNLGAAFVIGDPARPASARFYTGGDIVSFGQMGVVAGNVYAPFANMTFSAPLEVYGSLFARRINFSDSLTVHYDEAILTAGDECEDPDPTPGFGDGSGGDPCEDSLDCRGGICGADNTCSGDGSGQTGDPCVVDGDCEGAATCGVDRGTCVDFTPGSGGDGDICADCEDCGNQACNDGVCGDCVTDLDCCSPLICHQGECILVIP